MNLGLYSMQDCINLWRKSFMKHEIIIKVNSLEKCRYFYRENLKLGEPVTDSSELAEFKIGDNVSLVLEEFQAPYLEHTSSAVGWLLETDDFDTICASLKELGALSGDEFIRKGRRAQLVCDPEGNPLILAGKFA